MNMLAHLWLNKDVGDEPDEPKHDQTPQCAGYGERSPVLFDGNWG